jgi:FAD/FMN-containing dehydrogenase
VTQRVAGNGYFYAPDPSSQSVCAIGGNVAENSGGAHCLKYGLTITHTLALDVVLPNGELITFGSAAPDAPGYDLPVSLRDVLVAGKSRISRCRLSTEGGGPLAHCMSLNVAGDVMSLDDCYVLWLSLHNFD